jgi:hypothetical protein
MDAACYRIIKYLNYKIECAMEESNVEEQIKWMSWIAKFANPTNVKESDVANFECFTLETFDKTEKVKISNQCFHCSSYEVTLDPVTAEIICFDCAMISTFDDGVWSWTRHVNRYKRMNHFKKMFLKVRLTMDELLAVELRFTWYERKFEAIKQEIGRKYFPYYSYIFVKICEELNIKTDNPICLKQPTLKKTREKLDRDWEKLCAV